MASFGFSVGDFITGIQLGYKIIGALRDSGGSISHWKKLEAHLAKFQQAIETAKARYNEKLGGPDLDDKTERVLKEIVDALGDCGNVTERFLEEMEPYRRVFEDREHGDKSLGVGRRAKRAMRKTTFVFEKPAAVGAFQEALGSALRVYELKKDELEEIRQERDEEHQSKLLSVIREGHERDNEQLATLARVDANTSEMIQGLESSAQKTALWTKEQREFQKLMKLAMENIIQFLRVDQPSDRCDESTQEASISIRRRSATRMPANTAESAVAQIAILLPVALVLATFAELIHLLQHQLPRTIKHNWETWSAMSRSVLIYDATGRKLVFQIQICSSITQLHDMLEISFRNRAGYRRVKQRRYLLFDAHSESTINSDDDYAVTMAASREITMSIELDYSPSISAGTEFSETESRRQICPQCKTLNMVKDG